jgi:diguanylate cyclase (GGDEF)-like protein
MNEITQNSLSGISLTKLSLFSQLNEEELLIITKALKTVYVRKGEDIFKEGDTGKELFVLSSGAMSAYGTQSDGTQRKLFDITLGEFFGEMSIIAHEPRSATITAAEDSVLIKLAEADFYRIISDYPVTGYKILRTIGIIQNLWLDQSSKSYSDLIRWGESARRRAITDEMTGLYNRSFLEESIKKYFDNQSMKLRIISMLMIDLDKIHSINENYGTMAGDIVIISSAEVIRSCLRPGDIPSRLSGDEFAVLLPDTESTSAANVAERIRKNIENKRLEVPVSPGSNETVLIGIQTSIGIATAPSHASTAEELFEKSDTALRKAKELGRNRIEIFAD